MYYNVTVMDGSSNVLYHDTMRSSYALDKAATRVRAEVAARLGVSPASLIADAFLVGYGALRVHIEGA